MPLIKNLAFAATFIQTVSEDNNDDAAFFTLLDSICETFDRTTGYIPPDQALSEMAYTESMNIFDFASIVGPILQCTGKLIPTIEKLIRYEIKRTESDPNTFMRGNNILSKALLAYFIHTTQIKKETLFFSDQFPSIGNLLIQATTRNVADVNQEKANKAINQLWDTILLSQAHSYQQFSEINRPPKLESLEALNQQTQYQLAGINSRNTLAEHTIVVIQEQLSASTSTRSRSRSLSMWEKENPTQDLQHQLASALESQDPAAGIQAFYETAISETARATTQPPELALLLVSARQYFEGFSRRHPEEQIEALNGFLAQITPTKQSSCET